MAKTTTDNLETINLNIADANKEIAQLENRLKRLSGEQNQLARKARTRRLIERGAILESFISNAETLTNEQIKSILSIAFRTAEVAEALRKVQPDAASQSSLV